MYMYKATHKCREEKNGSCEVNKNCVIGRALQGEPHAQCSGAADHAAWRRSGRIRDPAGIEVDGAGGQRAVDRAQHPRGIAPQHSRVCEHTAAAGEGMKRLHEEVGEEGAVIGRALAGCWI